MNGMNDSGARMTYEGGALREPTTGKGRYDLLSPFVERRDALWLELGSVKYAPRNWEKGMEFERLIHSTRSHINAWQRGDRKEDHLAAARCNLAFMMHYEDTGLAPKWNHYPNYPKQIAERQAEATVSAGKCADCVGCEIEPADGSGCANAFLAKRDYQILAVDFDGCLCESKWPEIGEPNTRLIERLKRRVAKGDKLILWTCREGEQLREAVEWCKAQGLEFDAVNANLPEMNALYGNDSRKIGADVYIDDKALREVAES